MKNNELDIYALYDANDNEIPLMVGTLTECSKNFGIKYCTLQSAIDRDSLIHGRYKISYIGKEKIEEKRCKVCGKVKKISEMQRGRCVCKKCYRRLQNKYDTKRRILNGNKRVSKTSVED